MYQIESVFIGENQPHNHNLSQTEIKLETVNKNRVGDIVRLAPNNFTLNCIQCSQTFQHFPEFTLHIEEHFVQNVAFISNKNKNYIQNDIKFDETVPVELISECQFDIDYEFEEDANYCSSDFIKSEQNIPSLQSKSNVNDNDEADEIGLGQTTKERNSVSNTVVHHQSNEKSIKHKKLDDKKYKCMICGICCASKNNLKLHSTGHANEQDVFCLICMKRFNTVHYAQKHIKSIHKQTISTNEIRKAQNTLKQIVRPKKYEQNSTNQFASTATTIPSQVSNVKLNVLSFNYWRCEGKTYHCLLCIKWFTIPKYVQKHIRLVHGRHISIDEILAAQIQPRELKPDQTATIEMVKQQQIQSLQHQAAVVADTGKRVKSFECFVCHTMFVQEKALRYHFALHEGIQYACPLCSKFFSMQKYVRDHMIYRHGFDKKSKLPPLKWRKIENFEYHKPVVTRFECYLCHRTYPTRSKLVSHTKTHTEIMNCSVCDKIFKSHESRRRHMQLHFADPNQFHHCLVCNKAFAVRRYMMSHMRTSHLKVSEMSTTVSEKSSSIPQNRKPSQIQTCTICQKEFDRPGIFNKHMKCHNKEPTRYICDCCGYEFNDRHLLRKHLSTVHKINRKHFKCNICQKIVPKKREEEHLKWHRGEKEHQCEICGNQYTTAGLLNTHKKRQHTNQKYECTVCSVRFNQPRKFLHHRRSHTEIPMEIHCSYCQLGFFNARSLNKHEMKKHAEHFSHAFADCDSDRDADVNKIEKSF